MSEPKNPLAIWVGQRARELRGEQTPQEQQLWQCLRAKRFAGFKFRRQEPIGRYIADFVCFRVRLIVELDGSQHLDQQAHDAVRDEWLRAQGFEVLRVWNNEWQMQREAVLELVWQALEARSGKTPSPQPLSHEGRGALKPSPAPSIVFSPLSPRGRGVGGEGAAKPSQIDMARDEFGDESE